MLTGTGFSFWSDKNVLKWVVGWSRNCVNILKPWTAHLKWANCMLCKLYLSSYKHTRSHTYYNALPFSVEAWGVPELQTGDLQSQSHYSGRGSGRVRVQGSVRWGGIARLSSSKSII